VKGIPASTLVLIAVLALLTACEPINTFNGTWLVRLIETDRAYWVASAGDIDRTLVLREVEDAVSGYFTDLPDHQFAGTKVGDHASLTSRVDEVAMTLDLSVAGSVLSGELTRSVRDNYGGWWKWELNGRRR